MPGLAGAPEETAWHAPMDTERGSQLLRYYKTCYPFEDVFRVIPINEQREVSFALANSAYMRYNTFVDHTELAQRVERLCPLRIDIGAVYRDPPTKGGSNRPLMKELVFDVDLTDYKRECCSTKTVCNRCFVIVRAAVRTLDFVLREELGFTRIHFFFSGGRGVHCWVCDREALLLGDYERRAVSSYFSTVLARQLCPGEYRSILRRYSDEEGGALFETLFVRLDANVTSDTKHLLKAPFCIHPVTGKVCVALCVDAIDSMCVEDIPTLGDVVANPSLLSPFIAHVRESR